MAAVGLSLLAALGFASSAILSRQGMQTIFPLPGVMVSLLFSFLLASAMVLIFAFSDISGIPQVAVLWILALGVMNFLGGRSQNFLSVNLIGASRASLFVSSQAPFAAIFAIAFTGESIHPVVALGTVAVVGGLLFASGDSIREGWRTDKSFLIGFGNSFRELSNSLIGLCNLRVQIKLVPYFQAKINNHHCYQHQEGEGS